MEDIGKVLIVDDDPFNLDLLEQELELLGLETISATDGKEALAKLFYGFPGIIVSDVKMPRMDGLELMKHVQELDPELPIILVSGYGDIAMAVQAMHDGAYDFIQKPIDSGRLNEKLARALRERSRVLEIRSLRADLLARSGIEAKILGRSPSMVELRKDIANVADTNAAVLIRGATGTGKELVARSLHELSSRRDNNFVPLNCSAMPENLFESELFGHEKGAFTGADKRRIGKIEHAHNGTLFLDEIESMPLNLQSKLLRVLQEREIQRVGSNELIQVNFRLVAATQIDLREAAEKNEFRQDLFYRLNVAELHIPSLAERREDIPLLFETFMHELAILHEREVAELSREDLQELMAHIWPGNVRELRNIAERHVLGLNRATGRISELMFPAQTQLVSLQQQLDAYEKCVLEQELRKHNGNIQSTGQALGMPVRTLNDRMRKRGLNRKDFL